MFWDWNDRSRVEFKGQDMIDFEVKFNTNFRFAVLFQFSKIKILV